MSNDLVGALATLALPRLDLLHLTSHFPVLRLFAEVAS